MRGFQKALFGILAGVGLLLAAGGAAADTISYTLFVGNTSAIGPGPFGTVSITTNGSNVANVLFTANTAGGYAFVNGGAAAVNVNGGALTAGSLSGTLSSLNSGGVVSLSAGGAGNEDGFGSFNTTVNNGGAWANALATISFTLTKTTGTWGSASTVLIANLENNQVAAHVGYCAPPATSCSSVPATGFATVPIPAAAWLFGSGLVGLIAIARRRFKGTDSTALA